MIVIRIGKGERVPLTSSHTTLPLHVYSIKDPQLQNKQLLTSYRLPTQMTNVSSVTDCSNAKFS